MKTQPVWMIGALCWFFVLFNVERIVPDINLASFVYVLSTIAGLLMLGSRRIRSLPFGITAGGFVVTWIVGKSMLGYSVDIFYLPLAMTEVFSVLVSQYVCLKIAQNSDEFAMTSRQLLEVLRGCSVPDFRDAESQLLEEIRRARRHERPLTFVALTPTKTPPPEAIKSLLREMESSLSQEFMWGCISKKLANNTKSHDIAVRVGDQFLMLLPETSTEQAASLSQRILRDIDQSYGVSVQAQSFAFGVDELTLSGVLDRLGVNSIEARPPQVPEVYQLQSSSGNETAEPLLAESAS